MTQTNKIKSMSIVKFLAKLVLFLVIFFVTIYLNPVPTGLKPNTFYQLSTINALLEGNYGGTKTIKQLKKHGDFGHGTLDALNGELYVLDGNFYQIDFKGKIHKLDDSVLIPYINLTNFSVDQRYLAQNFLDFKNLENFINKNLLTKNLPYAIKIHGDFAALKLRSVPKQDKPYPPINEIINKQSIFNPENISGTMVGFLLPKHTQGILVPGFHFHFISDDLEHGGHVLDFSNLNNANLEIDLLTIIEVELPLTEEFAKSNLNTDNSNLIHKVEKDTKK